MHKYNYNILLPESIYWKNQTAF